MRTFAAVRTRPEAIQCLKKIGFVPVPTKAPESDYEPFAHEEREELLLVDFALGRFIHSDPAGIRSHRDEGDGEPVFDAILDSLYMGNREHKEEEERDAEEGE